MKVICWDGEPDKPYEPVIPEGVLLVAYPCSKHPDYYIVDGYSIGLNFTTYHHMSRFLVCSDLDEVEIYLKNHKKN